MIFNLFQKINPLNYLYAEQVKEVKYVAQSDAVHIETEFFKFQMNILNTSKSKNIPQALLDHISKKELKMVFDYFLDGIERARRQLIELTPGRSIRIRKNEDLPRTCTIVRSMSNEFMLFVHTKDILVGGKKKLTVKETGMFKSVANTWRIDQGFCEYIKLNADYNQKFYTWQKFLILANNECRLSQVVKSKYIVANHLAYCPAYANKKKRLAFFGIKAAFNLAHLIYREHAKEDERVCLIPDLLVGLKLLHDAGIVHRDIKPDNFVVKVIDGNRVAQYIDFGLSTEAIYKVKELGGTPYYFSPELLQACGLFKFTLEQRKQLLGNVSEGIYQYIDVSNLSHFKNDIWALGVVIFELKHGRRPIPAQDWGLIKEDKLLAGMLAPKREHRFNINQAIACYNKLYPNKKILLNDNREDEIKPKAEKKDPFVFNELIKIIEEYESEICKGQEPIKLQIN